MKIKLPSFSNLPRLPSFSNLSNMRRGPAAPPSNTGMSPEPDAAGAPGDRMRLLSRRLRGAAGYVALFIVVFFAFIWISLPTRAIAWRIGQAAREAGYIVEVEDLSISPFGGITLYNVTWTFQPSHSGQIPRKLELPEVDVDVAVLKLLFGSYDIEVDTKIDEATIHAAYTRSDSESTVIINVAELPLYDVPKLQQSLNAPLAGLFALDVDLTVPENQFARAFGSIDILCTTCKVGDGETLLYVPGATGIMAKGVTLPEIDLGSLVGKLVVVDGKATAEQFETTSPDLVLKITGGMNLADPFSKSEFALDIKLLITPVLQDRSEPLKLMVQTAGPSSKLDPPEQDWLGFKLRGSAGKPKFTGIKTKSKEERDREKRQATLERDAKRKAAKAKKDREAKEKAPVILPLEDVPAGTAAEPETPPSDLERPSMDAGRTTDTPPVDQRRPSEDDAADPFAGDSKPASAPPPDPRPEDARPEDNRPADAPPQGEGGNGGGGGEASGGQDGGQNGGQNGQAGQENGAQDGGQAPPPPADGAAPEGGAPAAGEQR